MERTGAVFFTEEEAVTGTQILFPGGKRQRAPAIYVSASDPLMERQLS